MLSFLRVTRTNTGTGLVGKGGASVGLSLRCPFGPWPHAGREAPVVSSPGPGLRAKAPTTKKRYLIFTRSRPIGKARMTGREDGSSPFLPPSPLSPPPLSRDSTTSAQGFSRPGRTGCRKPKGICICTYMSVPLKAPPPPPSLSLTCWIKVHSRPFTLPACREKWTLARG